MDLFYAFNDAYAPMAGISITSLLINNNSDSKLTFHIVDSGISEENLKKLKDIIASYNQECKIYEMPDFDKITGKHIDTGRWNINVFSKLFVGSILPELVNKVICIDCDTDIEHSLEELWNVDLTGKIVAGVIECIGGKYRTNLGKKESDYYFNSGLLMFNVAEMRKQSYEDKFWACMEKYGSSLAYLDQDVINAVVPQKDMVALHPKFNCITPVFCLSYKDFMTVRGAKDYYTEEEYNEAVSDPYIVHFTTFFMNKLRPWFEGSSHPKVSRYVYYKERSPWKDTANWVDKRSNKEKFKYVILNGLPKGVSKIIVSYLHANVVPKKNLKKMTHFISNN